MAISKKIAELEKQKKIKDQEERNNKIRLTDQRIDIGKTHIVPTLRDQNGNILLYQDPDNKNKNVQDYNQYISVELYREKYDLTEVLKVVDIEIKELFKEKQTIEEQINELFTIYNKVKDVLPLFGTRSLETIVNTKTPNSFITIHDYEEIQKELTEMTTAFESLSFDDVINKSEIERLKILVENLKSQLEGN